MALIFILLTQLINQAPFNLDFEVDHGRRLLPELGPGKTRFAKQSRVLRQLRHYGPDWKIRVLIDGEFTGIELHPQVILKYVRLVFRVDGDGVGDVLCVDGVRENHGSDYLLRHRYFGCMRNFYWNHRLLQSIDRSDSKLATKLRNIEGHCRYLAPFVDITLQKRYPSQEKENSKKEHDPPIVFKIIKLPPVQQEKPRDDPRPLDPLVDLKKQVRSRDHPRPLRSPVESKENGGSPRPNVTSPPHQARVRDDPRRPLNHPMDLQSKQVRPRGEPRTLEPPTEEMVVKSLLPNGMATARQARVRDDPRPLNCPVDLEKQVRPRFEPRPLEPPTGETGIKSPQPNGTATAQQARPRDHDESLTNVVDKDSFVHGLMIVFPFVFFILLKCLV